MHNAMAGLGRCDLQFGLVTYFAVMHTPQRICLTTLGEISAPEAIKLVRTRFRGICLKVTTRIKFLHVQMLMNLESRHLASHVSVSVWQWNEYHFMQLDEIYKSM